MADQSSIASFYSFGYNGSQSFSGIHFVAPDVAVCIYGNTLKFFYFNSGTTKSVLSLGKTISALGTVSNKKFSRYAYADNHSNIHLFSFSPISNEHKNICTIEGPKGSDVEHLSFSRDGTRLVSVSSLPECKIQVWNIENKEVVLQLNVKLSAIRGRLNVSFNPKNNNQLCLNSYNKFSVFKMENNVENLNNCTTSEIYCNENPKDVQQNITELSTVTFTGYVWGADNKIFVITSSGLLNIYDTQTTELLKSIQVVKDDSLTCINLTKKHVIVGSKKGQLSWISLTTFKIENNLNLDEAISQIVFNLDYKSLMITTEENNLYFLALTELATPNQVKPEKLIDSHKGNIVALDTFPFQHQLVTCGEDGTVRIWEYLKGDKINSMASKMQFPTPLSCVHISKTANLIAVGSITGVVRIIEAHSIHRPVLIKRVKTHSSKITSVRFHPNGKLLAVGGEDKRVCIIDSSSATFNVVGYVNLPGPITGLVWNTVDSITQLFVAVDHDHGDVFRIVPPSNGTYDQSTKDGLLLQNNQVQKSLLKLHWTPVGICMDPRSSGTKKQHFFCVTTDKMLKRYNMPERTADPDLMDDSDIAPPKEEYRGHEKLGYTIQVSSNGKWLATGAGDGDVLLRSIHNLHDSIVVPGHSVNSGGVSSLAFSFDSQIIVSSGGTTIFARQLPQVSTNGTFNRHIKWNGSPENRGESGGFSLLEKGEEWIPTAFAELSKIEDSEQQNELTVFESKLKELKDAEDSLHDKVKSKNRGEVVNLASAVHDIVSQNNSAPEIERLDATELIIDLEEKERLIEEGEKQVAELREKIKMENLSRDLISNRIKRECWDSMEQQSVVVRGLKKKLELSNFPLRRRSAKESSTLEKMKLLRRVELKEFKQRKVGVKPAKGAATTPLSGSLRELELFPYAGAKETTPSENQINLEDEEETLRDLLYHPFDLHTAQRKTTQINFLQHIVYDTKKDFNQQVLNLLEAKKNDIQKIRIKNDRMKEIIAEIREEAELFNPELDDSEVPERVLSVKEDEVKSKRFMSEHELKELQRKKMETERLISMKKDDSGERGLKAMLGGTMDGRLNAQSYVDEELIKPEHLNKPENELTEEEVKELKEFEKKVEVMEEEKEKRKKALETELKKLQSQILEICNSFDEQLQKLIVQKVETDQAIYEEELKVLKLSQALLREEQNDEKEQIFIKELAKLKVEKAKSTTRLTEFKRELEQYKEQHKIAAAEDKNIENMVRKELENNFEDYFDQLLKLFRKRSKLPPIAEKEKQNLPVLEGGEASSSTVSSSMDPYVDLDNQIQRNVNDTSYDISNERPEGIDVNSNAWLRFLELRQIKIEKEGELKRKAAVLNDMTKFHDQLTQRDNFLADKFESILRQLRDFREQRIIEAANLEILFKLKQGQVEVEQAAVVTDYSNSVLINRSEIEDLNKVIRALGKEKVELLKSIKETKKTIRKKKWENKKLDMVAEDLNEKTNYFKLLRVTKQLQELIKGGEDDLHSAEIKTLEKRADHGTKSHEQKILDKKKSITKMKRLINEKLKENRQLDQQRAESTISVSERKTIHDIQSSRKVANEGNANAMKQVLKMRRLQDIVNAQDEELKQLSLEASKLKERTFPFYRE